jgi:chemotaxis protein MotB
MSTTGQPIIVVKKKSGHGGHHGGAWKVAYADFVTAMMAFFLVMWLVGQSKSVKAAVGGYFRDPAVFEMQGGKGVLPGGQTLETQAAPPKPTDEETERQRLENAAKRIRERLDQVSAFKNLRKQIEFSVSPEGLRIDLLEQNDSTFFDSGSATLRGETERILGVIAGELAGLKDDIVVEGHTDSRPYQANDRYSNWELSADRANAARRAMERGGLRTDQVSSVRGLADRELRIPTDPFDARNRRVSILVKSPLLKSAPGQAAATPDHAPAPGAAPEHASTARAKPSAPASVASPNHAAEPAAH